MDGPACYLRRRHPERRLSFNIAALQQYVTRLKQRKASSSKRLILARAYLRLRFISRQIPFTGKGEPPMAMA
jgi:hypothetical protein